MPSVRSKRRSVRFLVEPPLKEEVLSSDRIVPGNVAHQYNKKPLQETADAWLAIDREKIGMY